MVLILGGAYQGKLTWAAKEYDLQASDCWDLARGLPTERKKCFYHLEALTWERPGDALDALLPLLGGDTVVIAREIGSGVVPMDSRERAWRENHGSAVKELARRADRVVRMFCGLPEVLK